MDWILPTIVSQDMNIVEKKTMEINSSDNMSWNTSLLRWILEENWETVDKMIKDIVDISNSAIKETKDWFLPDYKLRLEAKRMLLEATWYVQKKVNTEIKFNLTKFLYE